MAVKTNNKNKGPATSPTQTPAKREAARAPQGAAEAVSSIPNYANGLTGLSVTEPKAVAAPTPAPLGQTASAVEPASAPAPVNATQQVQPQPVNVVQPQPQPQPVQQQVQPQPQNTQQDVLGGAGGDNSAETTNYSSTQNNAVTEPQTKPSGSLQDADQSANRAVPQVLRDNIRRSQTYTSWLKREPSMSQDKIDAYRKLLDNPSVVGGYDMNEIDAMRVFLDDQQAKLNGAGNPNSGTAQDGLQAQQPQYGFGTLTADIPNPNAGKVQAIPQPTPTPSPAATATGVKPNGSTASASAGSHRTAIAPTTPATTTTKTTTTTHPSGGSTTKTVTESREKTRTKGAPTASAVSETPYKESDKEEAELWRKRNETNAKRIEEDKAYQKELEDKYGKQRAAAKEEYDKAVRDAANAPSMHEYIDSVQKAMSADQSLKELDPKQKKRRRALKIVSMIADIFGALANYKAVSDGKLNVAQKSLTAQLEAEDKATSEYRQKRLDYWQKRLAEAQKSDAAADRLLRSKRLDQLLQEYKGRLSDISTSQKGEQSLRSATVGQSRKAEDNAWAAQFKGVETRKSQAQKGEQDRATKRTEPGMQRYSYTTNRTSTSTANVNFNGKSGGSKKKKGGGANTSAEKKKENSLFFGDGKKKK